MVQVLDDKYFLFNLLITVGLQAIGFVISAITKSEKLFDLFGGLNFIVIAIMTMILKGSYNRRTIACVVVVCVSRLWLAGFLAYRALIRKGDARFENVRQSAIALLLSFTYQIVWVYTVSSPVIFILGSGNGTGNHDLSDMVASDWVGMSLAAMGAVLEIVADVQKYRFRSDRANSHKMCNVGVWSCSRHPNYLGEIIIWWGIFILGVEVFRDDDAGWSTVVSPVFTMVLLLCGSGVPTAEGSALKRFFTTPESSAACQHYLETTPPLWCCCFGWYKLLPRCIQLVCCCELPLYQYVAEGAAAEREMPLHTEHSTPQRSTKEGHGNEAHQIDSPELEAPSQVVITTDRYYRY